MTRNFYEELKEKMTYSEMPAYAANEVSKAVIAIARQMNMPDDNLSKVLNLVKDYTDTVISKASKSQALKNFALVIDYINNPSYLNEGLRIINSKEIF